MNRLKLCRYKFTITFKAEAKLPPFMGNTLRGALGKSLCSQFPETYERLFKTAPVQSAPNPFVISVPYPGKVRYGAGDSLAFTVTLFGSACRFENDIISAVKMMCRGKLENGAVTGIEKVYDREWSDEAAGAIPYTDTLTLRFLTPAEILSQHEPAALLSFAGFIDSLFGRICGIIDNYTEGEFTVPYALAMNKPYIKADCNFTPVSFQTSGQPVNGFMGTVRFFGDVTRYLPYIDLGSQIHIGKKTTRSCGEYRFEI